jgi:iron(III) transport system substrate-binding protein
MHGIGSSRRLVAWVRATALVGGLLLIACAPSAAPPTGAGAPTGAAEARPHAPAAAPQAAEADWAQVVAAARREGRVVISGPAGTDTRDALVQGFNRAYPDIQVSFTGGRGTELTAKLLTERAAGQQLTDLFITGTTDIVGNLVPANAVLPIRPFLTGPDLQDPTKWLGGKFDFADDAERFNLVYTAYVKVPIGYNPTLVPPGAIRSYRDLLDPRWRGQVVMIDPRSAGPGLAMATFLYLAPELGPDFLSQLLASGIVFSKDDRQLLDWVGRGQRAIVLSPAERSAVELRRKGVPLEMLGGSALAEGTYFSAASGTTAVINQPPNPNATRVYLNWLLSREGQSVVSEATGYPSRRLDAARDHLDSVVLPTPGVEYLATYKEKYVYLKEEVEGVVRAAIRD